MLRFSRLLAAICALTALFVSLPTDAGIGDKDLPLLNGEKAKLLYTVVGVMDSVVLATSFHCTSTERENGQEIQLGIEVFDDFGDLANDVATGAGRISILPGRTVTLSTRDTSAIFESNFIDTGVIFQGSARVFATSKNVLCAAMIVDAVNSPPTSMVMLPVFKATKQGGM